MKRLEICYSNEKLDRLPYVGSRLSIGVKECAKEEVMWPLHFLGELLV